jgi:hypothetical protein
VPAGAAMRDTRKQVYESAGATAQEPRRADLAPPGDIAIACENFRLCFSIVTCRGNSNPDVVG